MLELLGTLQKAAIAVGKRWEKINHLRSFSGIEAAFCHVQIVHRNREGFRGPNRSHLHLQDGTMRHAVDEVHLAGTKPIAQQGLRWAESVP